MSAPVVNEPSSLLNRDENEVIFTILGNKRQSKATAVVQLYQAHPNPKSWTKFKTGAICFVKDNPKKSYFIRLVDLTTKSVVFEQEMYDQIWYRKERPYFHIFPGDKFMVGLNFADEGEADRFHEAVNMKLQEKKRRNTIRRGPSSPSSSSTSSGGGGGGGGGGGAQPGTDVFAGMGSLSTTRRVQGKKKGKLTKADISKPSNFVHLAHVGWDPKTGTFDSSNISSEWKRLLDTVGVTETELQDEDTAAFIQDFVQKYGGIEEATRQLDASTTELAPEPPQRTSSRSAAPHHPSRGAPQLPPRGGAPPPPPHRGGAPPPPPPIGGGPPPPPPIPKGKGSHGGGGGGSGGGGGRKPPGGGGEARADLLSSIRQFKGNKLTHVDETQINDRSSALAPAGQSQSSAANSGGLAGALAKALHARQQAIQVSDDSEDEEEDEDDDEWED